MARVKLSPRLGKCLRYVVSRNGGYPDQPTKSGPVEPSQLVVTIEWSDLPKTINQASSTLSKLASLGLIERRSDGFYALPAGVAHIKWADEKGLWRS